MKLNENMSAKVEEAISIVERLQLAHSQLRTQFLMAEGKLLNEIGATKKKAEGMILNFLIANGVPEEEAKNYMLDEETMELKKV